jgi:hypothetical protein
MRVGYFGSTPNDFGRIGNDLPKRSLIIRKSRMTSPAIFPKEQISAMTKTSLKKLQQSKRLLEEE